MRESNKTEKRQLRDANVHSITALDPPAEYWRKYPSNTEIETHVAKTRAQIESILKGRDTRMLLIVGPCSIHDTNAGMEYATRLKHLADQVTDRILLIMRVYFEKPRTTVGWKGFINDPNLNGTYDVSAGMSKAREFLIGVSKLGMATATEWLDPFTPQYLGDLVSWGAIGARTTESQTHRLVASGLSMPIGFKNGTGGSVQIAIDGIVAAKSDHVFLGIDENGAASIVKTNGNPAVHLILRGGTTGPNYDSESVGRAISLLKSNELDPYLIVDCSHANSSKDHKKQPVVFRDLIQQRIRGDSGVAGLMLESHLNEGNQKLGDTPSMLRHGVSITDPCVNWEETDVLIREAFALLSN
jgi:3-deoxy-7-phosphoheptulonate synthase